MATEDGGTLKKPIFRDIDADEDDMEVTEMESMCMYCHGNGQTRMLLTKIPFFKEIVISSFSCDECGFQDKCIQPGGRVQEKGINITLTVKQKKDLLREVVKADSCTVSIPSLDFQIPPGKGRLTTVEGLIQNSIDELGQDQPVRKALNPTLAEQIEDFIGKLKGLIELSQPFDIVFDDPSGNTFVENPCAPDADPQMTGKHFTRTTQQDVQLGLQSEEALEKEQDAGQNEKEAPESEETPNKTSETPDEPKKEGEAEPSDGAGNIGKDEVITFHVNCPACNSPCESNMKVVDIPFFKEVVIMATVCEACGHRDNEVKGGAGIAPKGTRITLKLTDSSDLARDILKSDTAAFCIPHLDFEMQSGTLGGKFTTLEGLLLDMKDQLLQANPFLTGDSANPNDSPLGNIVDSLTKIAAGEMLDITIVLDDPAGNCYVQNVYAPDDDPNMKIEHYVRTREDDDVLGIHEMNTENYR
ncbi:unnamed protein product [Owenia fusiformis]|uniref:Uncharacterized protein n=1 Tax=Owenia fusiformis TaxID=6347 RepID=A0A8J1TXY5_OWEFU|nr:unnamed protein product [Owenia fusiformis]